MSFLNQIANLVKDPPPSHLFELSESGIAFAQGTQTGFQPFEPGTLVVSPTEDNLVKPAVIAAVVARLTPATGSKRRRPAAVILPDYAARVSILDFDSFPSAPAEQLPLVRFRVKKTIPFDIDSAAVSYFVQPVAHQKKIEVLAVTVSMEVMARYEALFRSAGYHPGVVTTSALAALNLYRGTGNAVVVKLSGRTLTVAVISDATVKLFRCVTLDDAAEEDILAVLHPTFAYVEDELNAPVSKLILCGISPEMVASFRCEVEPMNSPFGAPGPFNAGLLGYLELVQN